MMKLTKMNKAQKALIEAYNRGYRAIDNNVISPAGYKLKLIKDKDGYLFFNISFEGRPKRVFAHRLCAFQKFGFDIFNNNAEVMHINDLRNDFRFKSLKLGNKISNRLDCVEKNRHIKGVKCHASKLTDDLAKEIFNRKDKNQKQLSIEYNISAMVVSSIKNKKSWKHIHNEI